jgi:hypothetical protein
LVRRFEGAFDPSNFLVFAPDGRSLVTSEGSGNAPQLWDVATGKRLHVAEGHRTGVRHLSFSAAGGRLLSSPENGAALLWDTSTCLPFLKERLQPVAEAEPAQRTRIRRLIADLDSDDFAVRQRATEELGRLVEMAEPALRQALAGQPTPEARRRLEGLLHKLDGSDPEQLRVRRALEVLERVPNPAAAQLLRTLAGGRTDARLTREAQAGVDRLARRPAVAP